jgi:hypothetical protein
MAKFKTGGLEKGIAKELMQGINKAIAKGIQGAAVEIANGLVDVGPAWSGEFSASWDVVVEGQSGAPPRGKGRIYSYTKRNFPLSRYEKALNNGNLSFQVVNSAPHAGIAIDQDLGVYTHPNDSDPLKDPIEFGFRPQDADGEQEPSLRYDVSLGYDNSEKPNAMITAEADWYYTYTQGGGLKRDLGRGVSLGFKESF